MAKPKSKYVCQNCGYVSPRYLGRCPNCGEWNTLVEEVEQKTATLKATPRVTLAGTKTAPQKIEEVTVAKTPRIDAKNAELNRVLGGGIVPGSMVLIGGAQPSASHLWSHEAELCTAKGTTCLANPATQFDVLPGLFTPRNYRQPSPREEMHNTFLPKALYSGVFSDGDTSVVRYLDNK